MKIDSGANKYSLGSLSLKAEPRMPGKVFLRVAYQSIAPPLSGNVLNTEFVDDSERTDSLQIWGAHDLICMLIDGIISWYLTASQTNVQYGYDKFKMFGIVVRKTISDPKPTVH